jgi:hypothetical protein
MSLPELKKNENLEKLSKMFENLKSKEKEYMHKIPKAILENKINLITETLNELDVIKNLSPSHFEKIRKIAVQRGGLLSNTLRREIYKKAFFLNDNQIDFYYYKHKSFTKNCLDLKLFYNKLNSMDSLKLQEEENIPNKRTTKKDEHIIELDVNRTIANSYFEDSKEELNIFKKKLTNLLKLFFSMNPQYGYYQGFHDIALYLYLIFYNYEHLAIQMLQRISEFFLKDYMVEINNNHGMGENISNSNQDISLSHNNRKNLDKNFQFETVFKILHNVTASNDRKFWKFIQDNTNSCDPINTLPWIITLFTHDVQNLCLQLRNLDYILFSDPNAVYHMASYVFYYLILDYFK